MEHAALVAKIEVYLVVPVLLTRLRLFSPSNVCPAGFGERINFRCFRGSGRPSASVTSGIVLFTPAKVTSSTT